jgi:hypothetical protein
MMGVNGGLVMTQLAVALRIPATAVAMMTAVGLLLAAAPAGAGEVADLAGKAEELLQAEEPATAFDAMEAAVDAFWREAPLIIESPRFVPEADSATFAPGERVAIHLQPLGYGFDITDDGSFRISLSTGVEIRSPGGLIFAQSEDFGRLQWTGPGKNRAFAGRLSIDMPDLKPGDYELLLTVTDDATDKMANVTMPFSIETE